MRPFTRMEEERTLTRRKEAETHHMFIIGLKATCTTFPLCFLTVDSLLLRSNVRFYVAAALKVVGNAVTKSSNRTARGESWCTKIRHLNGV